MPSMNSASVLTLNAAFVPIGVQPPWKALPSIFRGSAVSVLDTDVVLRSPTLSVAVPSVITIPGMNFLPPRRVVFRPLNVIYRDDQRCQYCGRQFPVDELEIDHVLPRSRFKDLAQRLGVRYRVTSWENCVAACTPCNQMKRNRTPQEAGMRLVRRPAEPSFRAHVVCRRAVAEQRGWLPFLEPFSRKFVLLLD